MPSIGLVISEIVIEIETKNSSHGVVTSGKQWPQPTYVSLVLRHLP